MTQLAHDPWCWVHELEDYKQMFDLNAQHLPQKILDCAAGPSSFNAEATAKGGQVVSCDPLYATPPDKIATEINCMTSRLIDLVEAKHEQFYWDRMTSVDELKKAHRATVGVFLNDYAQGLKEDRYRPDALPNLSFGHYDFDLALCANFIFDGIKDVSTEQQVQAIKELCRVAREARIYPLLDKDGNVSEHVGPVMMILQSQDYGVEIREVNYHFQKNSNAMLRVWPLTCEVDD